MWALGAIIVLGIVIFAFDLISNLFGSKNSESHGRIPSPTSRNYITESEDGQKEYRFHALPYAVQSNYNFRDLRYDRSPYRYYSPRPSEITQGQHVTWRPLSKRYDGRLHSQNGTVQVTDFTHFRAASTFRLADQLDEDVLCAENAIGHYPANRPQISRTITPPEEPERRTLEKMLSDVEIAQLSDKEADYVRGFLEADSEKRRSSYEAAGRQFQKAKQETNQRLSDAKVLWEQASRAWDEAIAVDLHELRLLKDRMQSAFKVEDIARLAISSAPLPIWMPTEFELSFDNENGILIVEHRFPHFEDIEWVKEVALKRSTPLKPITITERKRAKIEFDPLITLSLATMLAHQFEHAGVAMIAVNGWVDFRSKSTGSTQRAFCASVAAPAARLREIDLEFADPMTAFHALKGAITPSLELAPVAPKVRLNFDDKRFVPGREVLKGMEQDENLASMDWEDFEHLCRELFEKVFATEGATVSVTQASRDQGVDAIIFDPDPIRGGKIVIQAKRYVNTVDVSAVRDLWGVVSHEGAMKGLLVTTSQFGPDSYTFAQGKPLTLINGSELLHLLEGNGYSFRINLDEARQLQKEMGTPPFKWRRHP